MKKLLASLTASLAAILMLPAIAVAHVVVTPAQTGVGDRTVFTVSVPNEKEVAVQSIRLAIPKGVESVQPDVAAGWDISTTHDSTGNVTSITWTGTIPVGQRADLLFKAQAPAAAGELDWKAYQTYADGMVVHWDQNPVTDKGDSSDATAGPYSVTKVIDDLNTPAANTTARSSTAKLALALSAAALALALGGLFLRRK